MLKRYPIVRPPVAPNAATRVLATPAKRLQAHPAAASTAQAALRSGLSATNKYPVVPSPKNSFPVATPPLSGCGCGGGSGGARVPYDLPFPVDYPLNLWGLRVWLRKYCKNWIPVQKVLDTTTADCINQALAAAYDYCYDPTIPDIEWDTMWGGRLGCFFNWFLINLEIYCEDPNIFERFSDDRTVLGILSDYIFRRGMGLGGFMAGDHYTEWRCGGSLLNAPIYRSSGERIPLPDLP